MQTSFRTTTVDCRKALKKAKAEKYDKIITKGALALQLKKYHQLGTVVSIIVALCGAGLGLFLVATFFHRDPSSTAVLEDALLIWKIALPIAFFLVFSPLFAKAFTKYRGVYFSDQESVIVLKSSEL